MGKKLIRKGVKRMDSLLLSAGDAAELIGIGRTQFYELHSSGRLPLPLTLGKRKLWRAEELRLWVQADCPSAEKWLQMKGGNVP